MLLVITLPITSGLFVVRFGGRQKVKADFQLHGIGAPHAHIVQGSTVGFSLLLGNLQSHHRKQRGPSILIAGNCLPTRGDLQAISSSLWWREPPGRQTAERKGLEKPRPSVQPPSCRDK